MFSQRFCKYIGIAIKLSSVFSANLLNFNANTKQFTIKRDYNKTIYVKINYCFVVFWIVASLGIILNFYLENDMSNFYIGFVYWLAIAFVSGYMLAVWFPDDFCQTINLTFRYLNYYQGNQH